MSDRTILAIDKFPVTSYSHFTCGESIRSGVYKPLFPRLTPINENSGSKDHHINKRDEIHNLKGSYSTRS